MLGSCDLIEAKSGDKTRIPSIFESFRAEYPTGRALVTTRSIRETRS